MTYLRILDPLTTSRATYNLDSSLFDALSSVLPLSILWKQPAHKSLSLANCGTLNHWITSISSSESASSTITCKRKDTLIFTITILQDPETNHLLFPSRQVIPFPALPNKALKRFIFVFGVLLSFFLNLNTISF